MSKKREFPSTRWPRLRDYWRKLYESTSNAMSRGGANVNKIITWARMDNWRRKEKKK